jgi:hypothetical protein
MKKYIIRRAIASAIALPFIAGLGLFLHLTAELLAPWILGDMTLAQTYWTSLTFAIALGLGWTFEPITAKLLGSHNN